MSWKNEYTQYWTTEFPEGEQFIYRLSGNTDSSDSTTWLNYSPLFEDIKFSSWSQVAEHLFKSKETFDWCYIDSCYDDSDENNAEWIDELNNIATPFDLFQLIIDPTRTDPSLLVREHNSCFAWLMQVREL
jgi:hypothetical protein